MKGLLRADFYLDDLLTSQPSEEDGLNLIQTAICRLGRYDINLCKVQANAQLVRNAYPSEEKLPEIINLKEGETTDLEEESNSLGLQWHIKHDTFSIKIEFKDRPKTKRGLLGHIMSVYDPQGIAAPAMLSCKLLQREIFPRKDEDPHYTHAQGWDNPIPTQFHKQWEKMLATCRDVSSKDLFIPRPFYPKGHG